jgi:hypothetical protein
MPIFRIQRIRLVTALRRDVDGEVGAVDGADVRRIEEVLLELLIERPLNNAGGRRRSNVGRAAIILAAAAAGLALGAVGYCVVPATGSRPEVRRHAALLELAIPFLGNVNRQDIGIVGRVVWVERLHHPGRFLGKNRPRRLVGLMRRVACSQQDLVGAVHQLDLSFGIGILGGLDGQAVEIFLRPAHHPALRRQGRDGPADQRQHEQGGSAGHATKRHDNDSLLS